MRNTIYLIRHAEAQSNIDPFHAGEASLTEEGISQSQKLAKYFSNNHINDIYVSEVLRAKLTADEISKKVNKVPIELSFLKERRGSYSNDAVFLPEESFEDMKMRLKKAKQFLEDLPNGHVIVVSHAIFIKALLAYIMTSETVDERVVSEIGDTFVIDNATISKLVFNKEKKKWRILTLNLQV